MLKDLKKLRNLMFIYLKGQTHAIILGFITALVFSLVGLVTPYITKFLIDIVFYENRPELLTSLLVICGIVLVIMSLTGVFSDFVLIKSFEKAKLKMRHDLFSKLLNGPANFLSEQRSGEINYRIFSDSESIQSFFITLLINIPLSILFTIIIGAIMVKWHIKMAVFVFLILLLQIVIIVLFRKPLLTYAFLQKGKMQSLSGFTVERFRNIQLIRSLNTEEKELDELQDELNSLKDINIKSFMLGKVSSLTVTLINNIWSFGILWYGGKLVLGGRISLGTLMAFLLISGMLYPRIASLTNSILSFQDVRASLHRFLEYYQVVPAVIEDPNARELIIDKGVVTLNNIIFNYLPNRPVLKGVNAVFQYKNITAIVGRSGAGKSTLARLLIRMYDPLQGNVLVDGIDIKDVTLKSLRQNIGYIVQGEFTFGGTIYDNICYGANSFTEKQVISAIEKAGLYDFIKKLPNGFNTLIGEGGVQISGGEAQRIALARAFIKNYKILILDEPTSFIDPQTEQAINAAIQELKATTTIIIIAHRLSTVKMADNILVLDKGVIVEQGKHEELMTKGKVYLEIYNELKHKL
jgi:ATP-binding cassette subfamily B protein